MSAVESTLQVTTLLESWEAEFNSPTEELATLLTKTIDYQGSELNLVGLLTKLAEIVEHETEEWYKSDPDPFDGVHPADPNCTLGLVMKILTKNDAFIGKLINSSYLMSRDHAFEELRIIACRLFLDIIPSLDTGMIFHENDSLIKNLVEWSQNSSDPLRSYATGLLGCAMELQDVTTSYKDSNNVLVPLMLRRLQTLKDENQKENLANYSNKNSNPANKRHFKDIGKEGEHSKKSFSKHPTSSKPSKTSNEPTSSTVGKARQKRKKMTNGVSDDEDQVTSEASGRRPLKRMRTSSPTANNLSSSTIWVGNLSGIFDEAEDRKNQNRAPNSSALEDTANSSSCWAELEPLVISKFCMWPLSIEMKQRLILTYLQPMGEYQDLLIHAFDLNVLDLLYYYIDLKQNKDVRLAFEALKYMGSLLCHKKFAVEFINSGGIQKLLAVKRPSVAATGVATCLFNLVYFDDPMERVCQLPNSTLVDLVSFSLWLLKCKHDTGRLHATMFLGLSFLYRVIVDIFDQKGGLRMLFNVMSTLRILDVEDAITELTDEELSSNRQLARNVTVAIRRYLEAHLSIKSDQVRRSSMRTEEGVPITEAPANKAAKSSPELIEENVALLLGHLPSITDWKPVNEFVKLGGIHTLLHLLYISEDWANYSGKVETLKSALDILSICCVVPRARNILCDSIKLPNNTTVPAVSILLSLALGQNVGEPEVQKAALSVIINSVCGPTTKVSGARVMNSSSRRRNSVAANDEPLAKMWAAVRNNNGIMTLLSLVNIKTPVTEADSIRALACKALVGLSRCSTVKQIISKLPMFTNDLLQQLMYDPILQDKHSEHAKFCRYASELIEQVSGKPSAIDPLLGRIRRDDIVARTNVVFNGRELLQLIHEHLIREGLHESAIALEREAKLQMNATLQAPIAIQQVTLNQTPKVCKPTNAEHSFAVPTTPLTFSTPKLPVAISVAHSELNTPGSRKFSDPQAHMPMSSMSTSASSTHPNAPSFTLSTTPLPSRMTIEKRGFVTPSTPVGSSNRISLRRSLHTTAVSSQPRSRPQHSMRHENTPGMSSLQIIDCAANTSVANQLSILSNLPNQVGTVYFGNDAVANKMAVQNPSLSTIVTSYLKHQHAKCRNPIVTCPPFSLLTPHQCPEPKNRRHAPSCITARSFGRKVMPIYGGFNGAKYDRKYIYSRFRQFRSYRDSEAGVFSSCAFTADQRGILLGTCSGDLKLYNIRNNEEIFLAQAHEAPITHIQPSRDGNLLLTSSTWGTAMAAVWRMTGSLDVMYTFHDEEHIEFSKQTQDKIIGTRDGTANIYDANTGDKLYTLFDSEKNNNYARNRATFGPTDELVLNDGVLWDLDSRKPIHKFDKFNSNVSGVFHPNGMEVIINSQVWDVRTYHLLYTVEALDQCQIRFNETGKIIYGAVYQTEDDDMMDESRTRNSFNSSFRTFDGTDYSNIATVDVKRGIYDLSTDSTDTYIAVVENYRQSDAISEESVCRLYEIGKLKDGEDDQLDDDEDDDNQDDDEDDDDDDDTVTAFDNDRIIFDMDRDDLADIYSSASESDFDMDPLLLDGDDDIDIDDDDEDSDDGDDDDDDDNDGDEDDAENDSGMARRLRSRGRRDFEEEDDFDMENSRFELSDMSNL